MRQPSENERKQLKQASQRAAIVSALGALVLFAALGVSAYGLNSVTKEMTKKQTQLNAVTQDLEGATIKLASAKADLARSRGELMDATSALDSAKEQLSHANQELESRDNLLKAKEHELETRINDIEAVKQEMKELQKVKQELVTRNERLKAENASLESQWEVASANIHDQRDLADRYAATDMNAPLPLVVRPQASAKPLSGSEDRFDFALWLEIPQHRRGEITKVKYFFNHPTFANKTSESTEASTGFRVGYTGFGALDRVIITLYTTGERTQEIAFNMYEEVNRKADVPLRGIPMKRVEPPEAGLDPAKRIPKYGKRE